MAAERIQLATGSLTAAELVALVESYPADVTFVDVEGVVRYYSERYRIFSRAPENVGTHVSDCHSPGTRPRIERLLSELASGWRDEAVFLEQKDGRLVHVRYRAVRDGAGAYVGVLEVAQWADEVAPPL